MRVLWPDVVAFVRGTLPPVPARVLEIGAGDGALAVLLRESGYDVVAIDPRDDVGDRVQRVALVDVVEPADSFDAAVSVVSLHHVEPLDESIAVLARVLRAGAPLIIDEFDVASLDDRAMRWWAAQQLANGNAIEDVDAVRAGMQGHLHPVAMLREALAAHFDVGHVVPGPYLHRWHLPPGFRAIEEDLIGAGSLPAAGARFVSFALAR